eukprot:2726626-Rhodomonas_salina.1
MNGYLSTTRSTAGSRIRSPCREWAKPGRGGRSWLRRQRRRPSGSSLQRTSMRSFVVQRGESPGLHSAQHMLRDPAAACAQSRTTGPLVPLLFACTKRTLLPCRGCGKRRNEYC